MKFPNFLPINGGPNAIPGKPGKYVEAPKSMMHEVAGDLPPMAIEREAAVLGSAERILALARARLGGSAVAAIQESAAGQQPAVPSAPPEIQPNDPQAMPAVAALEQSSGFWNANDPDEQRLMKSAAWAGDTVQEQANPAALRTTVESADDFFRQDFQMMPQQPAQQAPPMEAGWSKTDQDFLQEAGIANPVVDETRVMWDDLDRMAEMTPATEFNIENYAAAAQQRADDARRLAEDAHIQQYPDYGVQEDYRLAA